MTTNSARRTLLVIPACLVLLGLSLASAQGPYYFGNNLDPEYAYLFNSLNLLTLHAPAHTDHPGTTLQLLGAVLLFIRWVIVGFSGTWQSLQEAVLSHPEDYLHALNLVLNVLIACGAYFAARQVYSVMKSLAGALTLQASLFLFLQTMLAQTRVAPEPLLIATALFLMIPIIPMVASEPVKKEDEARFSRAAGLLFGFGVVTKVTFLPWGAVVLLFRGSRQKARFVAFSLAASSVMLLPAAPSLSKMAEWFMSLLTHAGNYGNGPVGIPEAQVLQTNVLRQFDGEPILFYLVAVYAVLLILLIVTRIANSARLVRLLSAGLISIVLSLALTVKHFAPHYILPALLTAVMLNALVVSSLLPLMAHRRVRYAGAVVAVMLLCLGMGVNLPRLGVWIAAAQRYRDSTNALLRATSSMSGCVTAGMYRSSWPTYALSFGNDFSGGVHGRVLEALHPNAVNYNIWGKQFYSAAGEQKTSAIRLATSEGQCILLMGTPPTPVVVEALAGFSLAEIAQSPEEGLYKLRWTLVSQPLVVNPALPDGTVRIEAEDFDLGNVVIDRSYYGRGIGVITTPHVPAFSHYSFRVPSAGQYDVLLRYASQESRPLKVLVNDTLVTVEGCSEPTGGYDSGSQAWQKAGAVHLTSGVNTLRLEALGPFPHVDKIAFALNR